MVKRGADLGSLTPLLLLALAPACAAGCAALGCPWWHRDDDDRLVQQHHRPRGGAAARGPVAGNVSLSAQVAVPNTSTAARDLCGIACGTFRWARHDSQRARCDCLCFADTDCFTSLSLSGKDHLAQLAAYGIQVFHVIGHATLQLSVACAPTRWWFCSCANGKMWRLRAAVAWPAG